MNQAHTMQPVFNLGPHQNGKAWKLPVRSPEYLASPRLF